MRSYWTLQAAIACLIMLTLWLGCNRPDPQTTAGDELQIAEPAISVKILVLDDESLGPVIQRQFRSRRNGEVQVVQLPWEKFADDNFAAAQTADLLIYPAWRLGELASRDLLVPISEDNARLEENANRSLLFSDRDQAISWGGKQVAMSMGQSHWVMLYRSEILETLSVSPPATWKEFDKLVDSIEALSEGDLPKRIAIPLQGHWASYSLLVRVASAIRVPGKFSSLFEVSTMQPLVDTEPFLKSLQAWQKQVGPFPLSQTPAEVLADYAQGEVAVALIPLNSHWLDEVGSDAFPQTTLSGVPGWEAVYDVNREVWIEQLAGTKLCVPLIGSSGMLVSASNSSQQQRNGIDVMTWMTSKPMSGILSQESPQAGMSRKVHLANPGPWLGTSFSADHAAQFADYMNGLEGTRRVLISLRIPGAEQYLQVLDDAVRDSILNHANAVETLASAASQWISIVAEKGMPEQKRAYRQSMGLAN